MTQHPLRDWLRGFRARLAQRVVDASAAIAAEKGVEVAPLRLQDLVLNLPPKQPASASRRTKPTP